MSPQEIKQLLRDLDLADEDVRRVRERINAMQLAIAGGPRGNTPSYCLSIAYVSIIQVSQLLAWTREHLEAGHSVRNMP